MNIIVCISSVPDTTSKINFIEGNTKFDTNGIQFVINPYDEFGLTKAIMLKEKHGGKVKVIMVGDSSVEPIIRKALAIGADEAIRINSVPLDSFSVANQIAQYIEKNPADLIIAGRESIDYNGGAVPGMIAELLSLSFVNACIGLDIDDKTIKITREIEGGKETVSCLLPIVIGGQKGLVHENELRIPNMRGIMTARTKPINIVEPSTNDIKTSTKLFEAPKEKASCKLVNKENVSELVELLNTEAKVI